MNPVEVSSFEQWRDAAREQFRLFDPTIIKQTVGHAAEGRDSKAINLSGYFRYSVHRRLEIGALLCFKMTRAVSHPEKPDPHWFTPYFETSPKRVPGWSTPI